MRMIWAMFSALSLCSFGLDIDEALDHPMSLRRSAKSTDKSPSNTGLPHGTGKRAAQENTQWTLEIAAHFFSTLFTANVLLYSMPVKVEYLGIFT